MVEVKICGMRRGADIEAANALLPDYVGFVFANSPRRVTVPQARAFRGLLSPLVLAVGVFVDSPLRQTAEIAEAVGLAAVQLHGSENARYVKALRAALPRGCEVWKAARVKGPDDIRAAARTGADRLLLDSAGRGGTGQRFDWNLICKAFIDRPFFLAGGITASNAAAAIKAAGAAGRPFGIDVSSGVETDGLKDFRKMAALVAAVRGRNERKR